MFFNKLKEKWKGQQHILNVIVKKHQDINGNDLLNILLNRNRQTLKTAKVFIYIKNGD